MGMDFLRKREEDGLKTQLKKDAYRHCDQLVKDYVDCTREYPVLLAIKCRPVYKTMNQCIKDYANEERIEQRRKEVLEKLKNQPPISG